MSRSSFWPLAIPLAIGILFLVPAVFTLASTLMFVSQASVARATYIGSVEHSGGNHGGTFLYPQFSFKAGPNAHVYVVTSTSGSTDQPYSDGDTVRVRYYPSDPQHAVIASFLTLWITPFVLAVFGLGFIAPIALILMSRRRRARNAASRSG